MKKKFNSKKFEQTKKRVFGLGWKEVKSIGKELLKGAIPLSGERIRATKGLFGKNK